jgi:hypothetical protein
MSARNALVTIAFIGGLAAASSKPAAAESSDVWSSFLVAFQKAGSASVASARAVFDRMASQLRRSGRDDLAADIEKALRDAKYVDGVIEEGLRSSRSFARFTHRGRPVSGKVVEVDARSVKLRTAVGKTVDLPLEELSPRDLVRASGLLRYKLATTAQVGAYYFVRGDQKSAGEMLAQPATGAAEKKRASYAALVQQATALAAKKTEQEPAAAAAPPPDKPVQVAEAQPTPAKKPGGRVPRTGGPYEPDALTVLLLHFDETDAPPADSSPTLAELTEAKNVTRVTGGAARHGGALSFNGHSSSLYFRSEGELALEEPSLTLEAWVKQHDRFAGSMGTQDIITQGERTGYHLGLIRGRLFFAVMMEGNVRTSVGDGENDMIELPLDAWAHVAATYDGKQLKLYVDGEYKAHRTYNGKPARPPDDVIIGSRFSGAIDEVRISKTVRSFAGLDRSGRGEQKLGLPSLALLQDVSARYDPARVVARRISAVGGAVAGHRAFNMFTEKALTPEGAYTFDDGTNLTGVRVGIEDGLAELRKSFADSVPEIVRICFGPYDIAKGRTAEDLKPRLEELVHFLIDRGALPVLYTMPMPTIAADRGGMAISDYNQMVRDLATALRVPLVDAHLVLNDPTARGKHLSSSGTPTREGYEALSQKFVELYRDLEYWVMARGPERVDDVAAADRAALDAAAKPVSTKPRPKGNLVANGGFEKLNDTTKFALGWTSHQWGGAAAKHSCRVDRAESHGGARSLVVRGLTEGAKSGAFTSVSLHPGPYEVRFWVSADVDEGKTAKVFCHLGGFECDAVDVGSKWTQVVHRITVDERTFAASLRLWTTAVRVRVWFDDVEVEAVE